MNVSLGKCVLPKTQCSEQSGQGLLLESLGVCVWDCNVSARTSPTPNKIYRDYYLGKCVEEN